MTTVEMSKMDAFFLEAGPFLNHQHERLDSANGTPMHIVHFHYTEGAARFDGRSWTFVLDSEIQAMRTKQ